LIARGSGGLSCVWLVFLLEARRLPCDSSCPPSAERRGQLSLFLDSTRRGAGEAGMRRAGGGPSHCAMSVVVAYVIVPVLDITARPTTTSRKARSRDIIEDRPSEKKDRLAKTRAFYGASGPRSQPFPWFSRKMVQ